MVQKKTKAKQQKKIRDHRFILYIIWGDTLICSLFIGALIIGYFLLGLPNVSSIRFYRPPMTTVVEDCTGHPIAYIYKQNRWPVKFSQIPPLLIHAFLSAEDARFYEHPGVDIWSVFRAMVKNVEAGHIVQGGSTITQQVTRGLLLSPKRTWLRKIKEAILAWQIDHFLTKNQVLTIYLNQIYLGEGAYGVEAAARTYFDKHVWQLDLAQCSLLAGLPQAPSRYDPYRNLKLAKKRQAYVLKRMVIDRYISKQQAEKAFNEPLRLKREKLTPPPGSGYFFSAMLQDLKQRYGMKRLRTGGLTIITTLDPSWQKAAAIALKRGIRTVIRRHPGDKAIKKSIQGAIVVMDVHTGAIKALIGGKDYDKTQFDRAIQSKRQPGSSFKPIIYAAALKNGAIRPNSLIIDAPISLPGATPEHPWQPENFEGYFHGPVTVRSGLIHSINIVAIKIARLVGLNPILNLAQNLGITVPLAHNFSIALGSSGIPLIQLVQAYSVFPGQGQVVSPQFVSEVLDRDGHVIERLVPQKKQVLSKVTAYEMVDLMKGVIQDGTGRFAKRLKRPAGGKTGTTDWCRDAWFIGFTPDIVTGVWIGREDNQPLGRRETGGRVSCPVWTWCMQRALKGTPINYFPIPQGIAFAPVNQKTGLICLPTKRQAVWQALNINQLPPLKPPSPKSSLPSWIHIPALPWFNE